MLIIIKNIQYDLNDKTITLLALMKTQEIYDQMKEDWMNDDNLIQYPFPMESNIVDIDRIEYNMTNGWKFTNFDIELF